MRILETLGALQRSGLVKRITPVSIVISGTGLSNTATVPTVDMNNTFLLPNGSTSDGTNADTNADNDTAYLEVTNATTLSAFRDGAAARTLTVYGTLVELWPGVLRRVQRATIDLTSVASATATIAAVGRSILSVLGAMGSGQNQGQYDNVTAVQTNPTTITASRTGATGHPKVSVEVPEFN